MKPAAGLDSATSHCRKFGPIWLAASASKPASPHGAVRQPVSSVVLMSPSASACNSTWPNGYVMRYQPFGLKAPAVRARMRTRPKPP